MTAAVKRLADRVRPELSAAAAAANLQTALMHVDKALEMLKPFAKKAARLPRPEVPGRSKEQRRSERNERAAEIRAAVMKRANGACEWCRRAGLILEWHHIFGGGARRAMEAVETTCGICWDCHRGWERDSLDTLLEASMWSMRWGFKAAQDKIAKRIAKVEEARRTPSVPIKVVVR